MLNIPNYFFVSPYRKRVCIAVDSTTKVHTEPIGIPLPGTLHETMSLPKPMPYLRAQRLSFTSLSLPRAYVPHGRKHSESAHCIDMHHSTAHKYIRLCPKGHFSSPDCTSPLQTNSKKISLLNSRTSSEGGGAYDYTSEGLSR